MLNNRLWVVTPLYFDVESFLRLRTNLLSSLDAAGWAGANIRLVVVDDTGGLDPKISQLASFSDTQIIACPFNLGHQRALVYGLRTLVDDFEDDDIVVTMDGDGEDKPDDISRLLDPLLKEEASRQIISLARRTKREETLPFKILYFFFKIAFRLIIGRTIKSGNFAAYRGRLIKRAIFHPYFDLCYSSSLLTLRIPISFVDCERGKRYAGESHMSFFRLYVHGLRMMMPFLDHISVRFLIFFLGTSFVGVGLSVLVLTLHFFSGLAIPGWAAYAILSILVLSFGSISQFVVLFSIFSQSQIVSLSTIDRSQPARLRSK